MKKEKVFLIALCMILLTACKKDFNDININLSSTLLVDKTWFLEYKQTESQNKTYVGQTTYFISFSKDNTMSDSDGNKGRFTISPTNEQLQIVINAKTTGGNPLDYTYQLESIGANNLILSFSVNNQVTKMFFSAKK